MNIDKAIQIIVKNLEEELILKDIRYKLLSSNNLYLILEGMKDNPLDLALYNLVLNKKQDKYFAARTFSPKAKNDFFLAVSGKESDFVINKILLSLKKVGFLGDTVLDFNESDLVKRYAYLFKKINI